MVPTLITINYALMAYSSLSSNSEVSNDSTCSKSCLETIEVLKSRNVVLTTSEDEEPEDQGRIFKDIDDDPLVSFVTPTKPLGEAQEEEISPTTLEAAKTLSKVASQRSKSVDKGKRYKRRKRFQGIRIEEIIQRQNLQEEASFIEAIRLQNLEEEETAKQVHLDALLAKRLAEEEEAKLEANAELAKSVIAKDMSEEDFAKRMVDLVNQRKKYFAEERAKAKRSKPMTQSQLRIYMSNYLKNQGTWKLSQLKKLKFEEIKEEFDKLVKQVDTFVPMSLKATKAELKRFGEELQTIYIRKGKRASEKDEASEEDDSSSGTNVLINPVPVAVKSPSIASYKIIKQGKKGVYQIVRENGTDKRYGTKGPTDDYERVFWENLKTIAHCLNLDSANIYMLAERQNPLSANVCQTMLKMKLLDRKMNEDCYNLLKMMEKQAGVRK
ncbi:hypothetical protein Tco_0227436 [Tanacetum coccineum]